MNWNIPLKSNTCTINEYESRLQYAFSVTVNQQSLFNQNFSKLFLLDQMYILSFYKIQSNLDNFNRYGLGCFEDLRHFKFQSYRNLEADDTQSLKFKWQERESNLVHRTPRAQPLDHCRSPTRMEMRPSYKGNSCFCAPSLQRRRDI